MPAFTSKSQPQKEEEKKRFKSVIQWKHISQNIFYFADHWHVEYNLSFYSSAVTLSEISAKT